MRRILRSFVGNLNHKHGKSTQTSSNHFKAMTEDFSHTVEDSSVLLDF